MMISTSIKLLVLILCASSTAVNALQKYGLQQLCGRQSTGTLILENPNWGTLSSAILVASTSFSYESNTNCSVIIQSKYNSSGIVISVRKIALRPDETDTLRILYADERKIVQEKMYDSYLEDKTDNSERESYHSVKNATITFDTGSYLFSYPDGFEFTVTTVTDSYGSSQFRCRNGLYIAKELKCDGRNHCGDRSDQDDCRNGNELNSDTSSNNNSFVGRVLIALAVIAGLAAILAWLFCCRNCDCDSSTPSSQHGIRTNISHIQTTSRSNYDYPMYDPPYGSRSGASGYSTYEGDSAASCYSTYEPTYEGDSAGTCYSTYEPTYEADSAADCYTYEPTYEADSAADCYSYDTYEGGSAGTCD